MNIIFNPERLEVLTPKFIIKLAKHLSDMDFGRLSINSVSQIDVNDLNQKTLIVLQDVDSNTHWMVSVSHAKDLSCSNWSLKPSRQMVGVRIMTPDGVAVIEKVDGFNVRVKHVDPKTPVVDYRLSDLTAA